MSIDYDALSRKLAERLEPEPQWTKSAVVHGLSRTVSDEGWYVHEPSQTLCGDDRSRVTHRFCLSPSRTVALLEWMATDGKTCRVGRSRDATFFCAVADRYTDRARARESGRTLSEAVALAAAKAIGIEVLYAAVVLSAGLGLVLCAAACFDSHDRGTAIAILCGYIAGALGVLAIWGLQ